MCRKSGLANGSAKLPTCEKFWKVVLSTRESAKSRFWLVSCCVCGDVSAVKSSAVKGAALAGAPDLIKPHRAHVFSPLPDSSSRSCFFFIIPIGRL
jgi:hypothetical protein